MGQACDSLYKKSDSTIMTYSTFKHAVTLGLAVLKTGDPSGTTCTTVEPGQNYKVQGTLLDPLTGTWLQGKTITFTADDPITISGKTTNLNGFYSGSQTAPGTSGTYDIQSHFAGDALYNSRDSVTRTLTVSSPSIASSTTDAECSTAKDLLPMMKILQVMGMMTKVNKMVVKTIEDRTIEQLQTIIIELPIGRVVSGVRQ
jgi:hypothetical protein